MPRLDAAYIAVVGPADASDLERYHAATVGRLLAEHGAVVLTGGLGGVMAAALRGASEVGGRTVALLPGADRTSAIAVATVTIATDLGQLRNGVLVNAADAVIAVGGSWGTLSEVALARRLGKPVAVLGGWTVADAVGRPAELVVCESPNEAVDHVLNDSGDDAGGP